MRGAVAIAFLVLLACAAGSRQSNTVEAEQSGQAAMHLHAKQQFEAAIAGYRKAASLDPGNARWRYYLATSLEAAGQFAEAERNYRSLPDDAAVQIHLAETLLAQSKFAEARDAAARAGDSAIAKYTLGRALAELGDHAAAIAALQQAAALAPDAAPIHYALADAYRRAGDKPKSETALARRAQARLSQVPMQDPWMDAVRALRDDAPTHSNRGRQLEEAGHIDEAIASYQTSLARDANYANAHINLVGIYGRRSQWEAARAHYEQALKVAPASEELHNNWGIVCALQGKLKDAEASFQKALATNPRSADALYNLAMIAAQQGAQARARQLLQRAVAADPQHKLAREALAQR